MINEALRIHPSTGTILERVVPYGGIELHGSHIPEGTIIGVNAWVINRNKDIFGEDVECFRPERWINNPPEKEKAMRKTMFTVSKISCPKPNENPNHWADTYTFLVGGRCT